MQSAPKHAQEERRLQELLRFDVLDTEDELAFDELTELASTICGTQVSLISLIDQKRQWFKSRVGIEATETPREIAFCAHAILQDDVFEVPNALKDERFFDNPLVTEDPDIRFYAGAPLMTDNGLPIGTLCVIDQVPKTLTDTQKRALEVLAKQVVGQLELRIKYKELQRVHEEREKIFSIIGHDLRSPFTGIIGLSRRLYQKVNELEKDKIQSMASGILSSTLQVYQVLDELMQWTQQRLGQLASEPKPLSLSSMAHDTATLLNDSLMLKKIDCQNTINPSIKVLADSAICKTIIRNLLANAIKFSPESGVIIISAQAKSDDIIVSIEDQGEGISASVIDGLFKQAVESKAGSLGESGTGIGLSLCRELVATQNGNIWVDDTYTQGARIQFSLPQASE